MIKPMEISEWDEIRKPFLNVKSKDVYKDGRVCRKCVWANTESGKILCSRKSCTKLGGGRYD